MSIALDLALYLREQKQDKPLTLAERGLLFTLMFRVGSNPFAWISQESLSIELDIIERNVRRLMRSIAQKGYIEILPDPKDKRKNLYRPAEFLINYHQQINRAQNKKYRSKLTSNLKNTGQNRPVNTGQNRPISDVAQIATSPVPSSLPAVAQTPKDTIESNIKKKETLYCAKSAAQKKLAQDSFKEFWNVYPRKKDKKRAEQIWTKNKLHEQTNEIISDIKNRLINDQQWKNEKFIPHASTYLKFERWNDEVNLTIVSFEDKTEKFDPVDQTLSNLKQKAKENPNAIREAAKWF